MTLAARSILNLHINMLLAANERWGYSQGPLNRPVRLPAVTELSEALPVPAPRGSEWIAAYRRWAGGQ